MTDAVLEIVHPGMMTSVQDLGRFGHQAQGVPVSGALDPVNLRLANHLVGNPDGQGALEFRIMGPTIKVLAGAIRIALTGTNATLEVMEPTVKSYPSYQSVRLEQGQIFRVGVTQDSAVAYLAVEGGFDLPTIYASQSTYVAGGIGGFNGRALAAGDQLPLVLAYVEERQERACANPVSFDETAPVRVILGPQDDYFTRDGIETFLSQPYQISADSNRMGARLEGTPITHANGADINSDGIVTGAIQVPGNGLPILLLADHQTTGGYPKIACVASADLPRLGRMKPGATVRFAAIAIEEAEAARRDLEETLRIAVGSIQPVMSEEEQFWQHLVKMNLIDAVM